MNVIIVTGSVGSGKTTLSKRLAKKLGLEYVDVKRLIDISDVSSGYDKKMDCKIVDVKKLNKVLINLIQCYENPSRKHSLNKKILKIKNNKTIKGIIIDSHLSHYLPARYVDLCVVTKCELKTLEKRLKKRKYSKDKIRENLDCEIFDICLNEAKEKGHSILVIHSTQPINISNISLNLKWN
ncbi:MAG: AAA family ATPase [Nanoarchaeota archaeon]|nr:AAA family ATPase [Nanoarchaeota archaeon]MBU1004265.1 AAA family ATPase [Nanoarchaeota archaeon]MBU1946142.1 AAA family ATPase [Nanoarchaeota archaeon]